MKAGARRRTNLSRPATNGARAQLTDRVVGEAAAVAVLSRELDALNQGRLHRVDADPERAGHGLAQLVLTLIDLLRQLLERQAIRRMEGGALSEEQIERMGETFMRLEEKMEELKTAFGLTDEDLRLNLGPLGDLL